MKEKQSLFIRRNGEMIATVKECSSLWDTGRGLIGVSGLSVRDHVYEGILLRIPSFRQRFGGLINSVHMIGMRFPISVFWICANTVVDKILARPGFHVYSPSCPCSAILELPEDALSAISIGDALEISKSS